jgi:hypothetical protein
LFPVIGKLGSQPGGPQTSMALPETFSDLGTGLYILSGLSLSAGAQVVVRRIDDVLGLRLAHAVGVY